MCPWAWPDGFLLLCLFVFQATTKRGKETMHTAARFVLATGERPRYLGIPGDKEFCITRYSPSPPPPLPRGSQSRL